MITYTDNFADNLKLLRGNKKISQSYLADKLDVAQSTIAMLENGERKPSYEMLEAIADYFDVKLDDLSGRKQVESEAPDFTKKEIMLVEAYREQPEMQDAVDRLLGLPAADNLDVIAEDAASTVNAISSAVSRQECKK